MALNKWSELIYNSKNSCRDYIGTVLLVKYIKLCQKIQ